MRKGITGDHPVHDPNWDPGAACAVASRTKVSNEGVELRGNRASGADSTVGNVDLARYVCERGERQLGLQGCRWPSRYGFASTESRLLPRIQKPM